MLEIESSNVNTLIAKQDATPLIFRKHGHAMTSTEKLQSTTLPRAKRATERQLFESQGDTHITQHSDSGYNLISYKGVSTSSALLTLA